MELDSVLLILETTALIALELLRRNNKNTSIVKGKVSDFNLFVNEYLKSHVDKSDETYQMVKRIHEKMIEDENDNRI